MLKRVFGFIVVLAVLLIASAALAQEAPPADRLLIDADPFTEGTQSLPAGVDILWPPPVSEVWGTGDVIGSAAVSGMAYYYLEYLSFGESFAYPANQAWIPVTVAVTTPVEEGVLATLDTRTVPDGIYALRLVVTMATGEQYRKSVFPIRVNNARFDAVIEGIIEDVVNAQTTPTPTPVPPTPTPEPPQAPYVMTNDGIYSANVRYCDFVDNVVCPVIGYLSGGVQAPLIAISNTGSGWYEIQLTSGQIGWIAPSVAQAFGNLDAVPRIAPPIPLPTPIPTAPPPASNILPNGIEIVGAPVCGQPYRVNINLTNTGNTISSQGTVTIQDFATGSGQIGATVYAAHPPINPGANFVVSAELIVNGWYNTTHEVRASVGTQSISASYTLGQGNCDVQPTPPPKPDAARNFAEGECFLNLTTPKKAYGAPWGVAVGNVPIGLYEARRIAVYNGDTWYRLVADSVQWVRLSTGIEPQGQCSLAQPR